MIKKLGIRSCKHKWEYIAECEVLDTETNEKFYVVVQRENLFYKTFRSSYIDYFTGLTKIEPEEVEGANSLWFYFEKDTRFYHQYFEALGEASKLETQDYNKRKYARIKKPLGNIKYKILNKRARPVLGCNGGYVGDDYEIEFLILPKNKHLFVYADDLTGGFILADYSIYDVPLDESIDEKTFIEILSNFSKAKKSQYYDLYLEMEKFKDDY